MSLSLAEQNQQWYPTSVQVTVLEARNLRIKGKNGTNDAYAIMQVAKDKFSTSVAEKSVAPVWKEEATFDLPLFHPGNADRCTLAIIIMHRALVGLDKLLGQAIINLLDLQENKARKKTDWYKLVDKNGKADKERGEVLLDIQFMRNNLTASMFDLSMQDKPRSRIAKLKDKVRGKKRDGLSDSASAIVPSTVSQVLTDSEGEGEVNSGSPKNKKSSKLKSLFAPKSNLHRGVSQSMSTLGTLPEKNSSLSSSRSSGLNVESTDVKNKFKFLGHKRTGSTDSKVSLGPFSLLNRSKQNIPDQNNLCINGSHVYAEDQEPRPSSGSTLSLNSSAKGSVEDLRKYHERNASDVSNDSFKGLSIPTYKPEPLEKALHAPQHPQEDEERKHKKTEGRLQELLEKQEEQDRKRQQEREEKKRKQEEEERKIRLEEEERKRQEEEEHQRKKREEEAKKAEEQKRQEESRVAERLTSLFGLGKKKEETSPPPEKKHIEVPASTNPFEEIPLSPDTTDPYLGGSPAGSQKEVRTTFTPTPPASVFPGRTAKVSAVKPRSSLSPKPETDNNNPLASPVTSDIQTTVFASALYPKSSQPNDPFESFSMFSEIHSSLAPPKPRRTFAESPRGSVENLSECESTTSMSEKKRRAPQPPSYPGGSNHHPKNEVNSPDSLQGQRPPLPLPDYDALFPRKRHGVMTNSRWEHIIAEVNQRKIDANLQHTGDEMSVDSPNEPITNKSAVIKDRTSSILSQPHKEHLELSKEALMPPKPTISATARQVLEDNPKQVHISDPLYAAVDKSRHNQHQKEHLEASKEALMPPKPTISATARRMLEDTPKQVHISDPLHAAMDKSSHNQHHKDQIELSKEALMPSKPTISATARQVLEVNPKQVHTSEPLYAAVDKSSRNQHHKEHLELSKEALMPPKPTVSATATQALEVTDKQVHTSEPLYAAVDKSSRNQHHRDHLEASKEALMPPKPTVSATTRRVLEVDSKQFHTSEPLYGTADKSNHFTVKVLSSAPATNAHRSEVNEKGTLNTTFGTVGQASETKEKPTPVARVVKKSDLPEYSSSTNDTTLLPSAKPREKASKKEPVKQVQPKQLTPSRLTFTESAQVERKKASMTNKSSWEKRGLEEGMQTNIYTAKTDDVPKAQTFADVSEASEEKLLDSDPFPNDELISQDPWALPQENMDQVDLFTGDTKKTKSDNLGLTPEDFDNIFGSTASKNETDPFFGSVASKDETDPFFGSVASKDEKDPFLGSVALTGETSQKESHNSSSLFQKETTKIKKQAPQTPVALEKHRLDRPDPQFMHDTEDVELTVTSVAGPNGGETTVASSKADLWGFDPFTPSTPMWSSSVTPELTGSMSGGKTMLRAWVSPSEVQSVSSQNGGGAFIPRRPHPVKPLSSTESQPPSNISVLKDLKTPNIREVAEKSKTVESGPYTQLTQEELITLVVKQQAELSKKDAKILELEDYIDNLLVRVIEEKPSILLAMNSKA